MRRLATGIARLLLAIFLVIMLFFVLVFGAALVHGDDEDEDEAANFCALTPLGQSWPDVAQRIAASKADKRQSSLYTAQDGAQSVGVTFHGFFPMARHVCVITLEDGRVRTKFTRFLD